MAGRSGVVVSGPLEPFVVGFAAELSRQGFKPVPVVIDARDGAVDTVTCGAGTDLAKLDVDDVIADATAEAPNGSCERVISGGSAGDPAAGRNCHGHANRGEHSRDPADDEHPTESQS